MKKLGHSQERDGLSPIPTDHRDGLGSAPRPPLCLGAEMDVGNRTRSAVAAQSDMGLSRIGTGFYAAPQNLSYR